jgi:hypothetical protein
MRPPLCRTQAVRRLRETDRDPLEISRAADRRRRQGAADVAGVAPCPRCRAPLVARMGRRGPYFHCLCAEGMSPHLDR